ncbi:hypothetical protein A0H81_14431 [Grifola frondosa]|uniref:Uncharacterized protein n=1 Tax=Grifola frondosa TaxID=5627 RepID=A0A1C7LLB6_GRIFR|nr:hypothetical protein A0H81_14431 [Grifola frondosa]
MTQKVLAFDDQLQSSWHKKSSQSSRTLILQASKPEGNINISPSSEGQHITNKLWRSYTIALTDHNELPNHCSRKAVIGSELQELS